MAHELDRRNFLKAAAIAAGPAVISARGARSPRCDLRTKRSSVLSALRIGTPVPGQELRLGLLRFRLRVARSGGEVHLWYGNYGAEFWRLHGPRIRRVLGQ